MKRQSVGENKTKARENENKRTKIKRQKPKVV